MKKLSLLIILFHLCAISCFSQSTTVGSYTDRLARQNQLLGIGDNTASFSQHPLVIDSSLQNMVSGKSLLPSFKLFGIPSGIKILPFTWLSDYNSKLPYGYNNSSLYPNVGYQTMVTGGIHIRMGILNIQLKPEFVHAENAPFSTFANVQANYVSGLISVFFHIVGGIDAPERFGGFGISRAYPGQSKITLSYANIEAGISTENMWWGPGVQNSIMMSNSAPGFLHWTFNTVKPIVTPIGSFEWQLVGGILRQSGFTAYDPGPLANYNNLYTPKPLINRYLSAFTFNWQPKWVEGLYLGVSGYDYLNKSASFNAESTLKKFVPIFFTSSLSQNKSSGGGDGQDFAYAINIRQVLKKYNAEIYFEYARNDASANFRDFFLEPEHSTAYMFGGSRFFNLKKDQFVKIALELTHLQTPDTFLLREEPIWYTHPEINPRDGYTNLGRYIGAGIGPGSNSLMVDFSYIKKLNSFGVKLERYVHDNDLYYSGRAGTTDYVSHWVDFSSTFYANLKFRKYLISAEYAPVSVLNYEYLQKNDISNKHARLTLTYFFD